ncbi:MAG: radical SAM protein [Planctomycetota bacterium]|nr:MAG: radical SAM protein [Planctomycetota bacterium]
MSHPCFEADAHHSHARVHLPVAPRCNVQCNFCSRKFDCVNESRPGVSTAVLGPEQASWYVDELRTREPRLSVIGIAGPGDPLANPKETLTTFDLTAEKHGDLHPCLSTNGMALPEHIDALLHRGVEHLTVTVNAVDPIIGARIYAWVRDGNRVLRGEDGARRLLLKQMAGIRAAVAGGMTVKINCILIPSVNDHHVVEVARSMAELGVHRFNLMPLIPVAGTPFSHLFEPDAELVNGLRAQCEQYLPQMRHCQRCRADAAGIVGEDNSFTTMRLLKEASAMSTTTAPKPYVAVASIEGVFVNSHLGHTDKFLIYEEKDEHFELVDVRPAPVHGNGDRRWQMLCDTLKDCRAVVAAEAGASPIRALGALGISVFATEGPIDDALEAVFSGNTSSLRQPKCTTGTGCGSSCGSGGGMACA